MEKKGGGREAFCGVKGAEGRMDVDKGGSGDVGGLE